MMPSKKIVMGSDFIQALIDAGVVEENCTQVIIEARYDNVVRVHYSSLGDEVLFELVAPLSRGAFVREFIANEAGEPVEATAVRSGS